MQNTYQSINKSICNRNSQHKKHKWHNSVLVENIKSKIKQKQKHFFIIKIVNSFSVFYLKCCFIYFVCNIRFGFQINHTLVLNSIFKTAKSHFFELISLKRDFEIFYISTKYYSNYSAHATTTFKRMFPKAHFVTMVMSWPCLSECDKNGIITV